MKVNAEELYDAMKELFKQTPKYSGEVLVVRLCPNIIEPPRGAAIRYGEGCSHVTFTAEYFGEGHGRVLRWVLEVV